MSVWRRNSDPSRRAEAQRVPPLNPFKLYANTAPVGEADRQDDDAASVKVVDLLGGVLPAEDGQELTAEEVAELIARAQSADEEAGKPRPGEGQERHDARRPARRALGQRRRRDGRRAQHVGVQQIPLRKRRRHRRHRGARGQSVQGTARGYAGQSADPPRRGNLAGEGDDGCRPQRAPRRCARGGPGDAGHAGALGDPRQQDGADSLQRVRRRPGAQGHRHAQRRGRVRRQRVADRRAHGAAGDDGGRRLRPPASTTAFTIRRPGRASRPS